MVYSWNKYLKGFLVVERIKYELKKEERKEMRGNWWDNFVV